MLEFDKDDEPITMKPFFEATLTYTRKSSTERERIMKKVRYTLTTEGVVDREEFPMEFPIGKTELNQLVVTNGSDDLDKEFNKYVLGKFDTPIFTAIEGSESMKITYRVKDSLAFATYVSFWLESIHKRVFVLYDCFGFSDIARVVHGGMNFKQALNKAIIGESSVVITTEEFTSNVASAGIKLNSAIIHFNLK